LISSISEDTDASEIAQERMESRTIAGSMSHVGVGAGRPQGCDAFGACEQPRATRRGATKEEGAVRP
jgi:hypothetical protein